MKHHSKGTTMKLYELNAGDKFQIIYEGEILPEILEFSKIDGAYSICFDSNGDINHISANTEVKKVARKSYGLTKEKAERISMNTRNAYSSRVVGDFAFILKKY